MAAQSTLKLEPEKDLVVWTAPARPFKRRSKDFFITVSAMAAVVALVLFLIEGWLPVILVISLVFLFYVMSTVEPENIEYKVTTKGIKVAGRLTEWDLMGRFWFTKRFDNDLLVVEIATLPGRLEVVINADLKDKIVKEVSEYLIHEEVSPSNLDKAAGWISGKLPGNK